MAKTLKLPEHETFPVDPYGEILGPRWGPEIMKIAYIESLLKKATEKLNGLKITQPLRRCIKDKALEEIDFLQRTMHDLREACK